MCVGLPKGTAILENDYGNRREQQERVMKAVRTIFDPSQPAGQPDLCNKFMKCLRTRGKQATAERIFGKALATIQRQLPYDDPIEICERAMAYSRPIFDMRVQRLGDTTYQVLTQIDSQRQETLAIRRLIGAARAKSGRPMYVRLASEIVVACRRGPGNRCFSPGENSKQ
jgi:small subunit ribosomal protein S7